MAENTMYIDWYMLCMGVMAYIKCTHNCSGIFPKLRIAVAFLKFTEIAMASIQLTLQIVLASLVTLLGHAIEA
jgi:hypothetical protein